MFAIDKEVKEMDEKQQRDTYELCLDNGFYEGAVAMVANKFSQIEEEWKKIPAAKWCEKLQTKGNREISRDIKKVHFDSNRDYEFWKGVGNSYLEIGNAEKRLNLRSY